MLGKTTEFLKKIGKKILDVAFFMARKVKAGIIWFGESIFEIIYKIESRRKPDIFVLVERIFIGFFYGIYAGIKDAINSWKFDRSAIEDYDIKINDLYFHET